MKIDELDLICDSAESIKGVFEIISIFENAGIENIQNEVWHLISDICYRSYENLKTVIDNVEVTRQNISNEMFGL